MAKESTAAMHVRDADRFGLAALFAVIARRLRLVVLGAVLGLVIGIVLFVITPPRFDARSTFLPGASLEGMPSSSASPGLRAAAQQFGLGGLDGSDPTEVLSAILVSRSFLLSVADAPVGVDGDTTTVRAVLAPDAAGDDGYVKVARRALRFAQDADSGLITVELRHAEREASMAALDVLVDALDRFHRALTGARAADVLDFVATRLDDAESALRAAEEELRVFLERNQRVAESANLSLEKSRLEREVQIQLAGFMTLREQHELARIKQVNEVAVIMVVDRAWAPQSPSWPSLPMLGVLGCVLGLLGAVVLVLVVDYVRYSPYADASRGAASV